MEPPSDNLVQRLLDLKLCSSRDLRRCRRRVRRLARDLPAFDSVWIDALVHNRALTPFQARMLESSHPDRLAVGPCVLADELGRGRFARTYLARQRGGKERCVLKLIQVPPEDLATVAAGLEELAKRFGGRLHPSIIGPHACVALSDEVVTISRRVAGPHLAELLVRRGRFPAGVVHEIARQLLDGLAVLNKLGCVHGDIRLANARLMRSGQAVLVDAGIAPVVSPELTIHAGLSPERYDGVAPELIGTGQRPDSRSDLYALGCLLWQLLAGRPPFPTGDPLARLAAHQTRNIPDVRTWAPDTPPLLAEAIQSCTARNPEERPQSADELLARLGKPRMIGRRRLARFRSLFEGGIPGADARPDGRPSGHWPLVAALLFMLSGATFMLFDSGARSELLRLTHRRPLSFGTVAESPNATSPPTVSHGEPEFDEPARKVPLLPFPAPNAEGLVLLSSSGPYEPAEIAFAGHLTIRGDAGAWPEVVIADKPFKVWAQEITLENVSFRRHDSAGEQAQETAALVLIESQSLDALGCSFHLGPNANASPRFAIAWKPLDERDPSAGRLKLENCVLTGEGTGLFCARPPRAVSLANTLKLGSGPLLMLAQSPPGGTQLQVQLDRVTLRESGAVIRWKTEETTHSGRIAIQALDCIFEPEARSALLELIARQVAPDWMESVQIDGDGCLAPAGVAVARSLDPVSGARIDLETSRLSLEGISTGPFGYAGAFGMNPDDSQVISYQAPRRSPTPPGIDAARLPQPLATEQN